MLSACLFLVLLSTVSFSEAQHGNYHYRNSFDENMRLRRLLDEDSRMALRADDTLTDRQLVSDSLNSVANLIDSMLDTVNDAKAGKHTRGDSNNAALDKHLKETRRYIKLLEERANSH